MNINKMTTFSMKIIKGLIKRTLYFGFNNYCICCRGIFRKFLPFGLVQRKNALCPNCKILERHRLLLYYLKSDLAYIKFYYYYPIFCTNTLIELVGVDANVIVTWVVDIRSTSA